MDSCEEQAQIMANQQMLRTQVKEWSRAYSNHQEDGSLPDHHWDKRLREAEAIAIAYQEVFQKYRLNPSGDIRVAFVMGWDEVLDNIAQSEETGTPCSCKSTGMLSLFDILNEQEAREVQSCMFHPLFQQVMELTDLCQHRFSREINKAQRNRTGPPEPLNQIFTASATSPRAFFPASFRRRKTRRTTAPWPPAWPCAWNKRARR